ncbi:MAG: glutaredoxin family protein [Actinomycetota bacterium]
MVEAKHVPGKDKGKVIIYALSTCIWCKKTKNLLKDMGIDYSYIDVDLLEGDEREQILAEMKKHNPDGGFPTLVIDDSHCIVGFDEKKISEKLGEG